MFLIDSFCRLPKLDGFKPSSLSAADIERASGDACRLQTKGKRRALRPAPPLSLSSFSLAIAL